MVMIWTSKMKDVKIWNTNIKRIMNGNTLIWERSAWDFYKNANTHISSNIIELPKKHFDTNIYNIDDYTYSHLAYEIYYDKNNNEYISIASGSYYNWAQFLWNYMSVNWQITKMNNHFDSINHWVSTYKLAEWNWKVLIPVVLDSWWVQIKELVNWQIIDYKKLDTTHLSNEVSFAIEMQNRLFLKEYWSWTTQSLFDKDTLQFINDNRIDDSNWKIFSYNWNTYFLVNYWNSSFSLQKFIWNRFELVKNFWVRLQPWEVPNYAVNVVWNKIYIISANHYLNYVIYNLDNNQITQWDIFQWHNITEANFYEDNTNITTWNKIVPLKDNIFIAFNLIYENTNRNIISKIQYKIVEVSESWIKFLKKWELHIRIDNSTWNNNLNSLRYNIKNWKELVISYLNATKDTNRIINYSIKKIHITFI